MCVASVTECQRHSVHATPRLHFIFHSFVLALLLEPRAVTVRREGTQRLGRSNNAKKSDAHDAGEGAAEDV